MSIAVLNQVYDEMRRLAIAGSVVAGGDFRLKKLIAPLEQAGAKAPVFAKVAEAASALIESHEQSSAHALLELCTLVNAALYTQGETGLAGEFMSLKTTEFQSPAVQASAQTLKPLLQALSTTGAGRLEIIRDSFERGAFRDLRLVKPALTALDDVYPDVGSFVADNVLPLYGRAILTDLKSQFDLKGKGGHPRRLILMHRLDPAGTREIVKQALDSGSIENRVAAIECLGGEREDLTFLLEQSTAKAKDVRAAALKALSKLDDEQAIDVLKKALSGADIQLAVQPAQGNRNPKLLKFVIEELQREFDTVCQSKDKKAIAASADRIEALLGCLDERDDKATETFLLNCFDRRDEMMRVKCEDVGGTLNNLIGDLMSGATKKTQQTLITSHATLEPQVLSKAFHAAAQSMKPADVFKMFSPYLAAKVNEKKQKDPAYVKRYAICQGIIDEHRSHFIDATIGNDPIAWDSRWLDLAVTMKNFDLVEKLARPDHAGTKALLSEMFNSTLKQSKEINEFSRLLPVMVGVQHPDSTSALVAVLSKYTTTKAKYRWGAYWIAPLIADLPKSAVPILEELLPTLDEKAVDELIGHLNELKSQT